MDKIVLQKIDEINEAGVRSFTDENNASIIKNFTETVIRVLEADFGFAYGKFNGDEDYKIIYKSPNVPEKALINKGKDKYSVNIPIRYGDNVYGSIIAGYKTQRSLKEYEKILSKTIANGVTQAITINWLIENERKALSIAEKQKETEILLEEEKQKTQFIANATHEFRTPLAIMRGNVELELLNKKPTKQSARKVLNIVNDEIIHLSSMIMELAVLANPEGNKKNMIHLAPVNIGNLMLKTIERAEVLLNKKKITLTLKNNAIGTIIDGDQKYLGKMFINLIRNAITYGKTGGNILIEIQKNKGKIIIKVADDGVGITKKELPHIFERFFRTEKARMLSNIGTGLGLSIVKWVAETHNGDIKVTSKEGQGTTFTITLPLTLKK
jgi:signal transduction histidine kinase